MLLYIARHGEAGAAADDSLRELTANGRSETRAVYERFAARIEEPIQSIICSPLLRARQTALLARQSLPNVVQEPVIAEELKPASSPALLGNLLDRQSRWPVMLVGHQPVLGELLSWLTDEPDHRYNLPTSSLHAVELIAAARGCGTLIWHS